MRDVTKYKIYLLKCRRCEKVYVGSTKDIEQRMTAHRKDVRHKNSAVYVHFRKHGFGELEIVCEALSRDVALKTEQTVMNSLGRNALNERAAIVVTDQAKRRERAAENLKYRERRCQASKRKYRENKMAQRTRELKERLHAQILQVTLVH